MLTDFLIMRSHVRTAHQQDLCAVALAQIDGAVIGEKLIFGRLARRLLAQNVAAAAYATAVAHNAAAAHAAAAAKHVRATRHNVDGIVARCR